MALKDIFSGLILTLLSIFGFISTSQLDKGADHVLYGPGFFPNMFLSILCLGGLIIAIRGAYRYTRQNQEHRSIGQINISLVWQMFLFILLIAIYITIFQITGFITSTIAFLIVAQFLYGRRHYVSIVTVSILGSVVTYLVLAILFEVPLPLITD